MSGLVETYGHPVKVIKTANRMLGCKKYPGRKYCNFCYVGQGRSLTKAKYILRTNLIDIYIPVSLCVYNKERRDSESRQLKYLEPWKCFLMNKILKDLYYS